MSRTDVFDQFLTIISGPRYSFSVVHLNKTSPLEIRTVAEIHQVKMYLDQV